MLHLPIACWLLVGVAYVGGGWFASGMDAWTSCVSQASCSSTTC